MQSCRGAVLSISRGVAGSKGSVLSISRGVAGSRAGFPTPRGQASPRPSRGVAGLSKPVVLLTPKGQHRFQDGWFGEPGAKGSAGSVRALSLGGEKRDDDAPERSSETGTSGKDDAQGEEQPVFLQALEFSKKFDPEPRQKLPSGVLGNLRIHFLANVSMFERGWVGMALGLINRGIDPKFELDDIMEGAITAYRVIRQIASNAKTAEELALLAPFVSASLLDVLQSNLAAASTTQRNTGLHVHDVCGEVVDVKLRMHEGEDAEAPETIEGQHKRGSLLLRKAQWLQLKIRFVALETDFVSNGPDGKHDIATEMRPSTWTLEGQVWELLDADPDESVSPIDNRRRNPEASWRLSGIGL